MNEKHHHGDYLSEATRIREEVAATIEAKEAKYTQEAVALGDIIDNTEMMTDVLSIGELNGLVCGAATEDCDDMCGGALCKSSNGKSHCGNPDLNSKSESMCEDSLYKTGSAADGFMETAEAKADSVNEELGVSLEETGPIREKALETKATASDVHDKATDANNLIHSYHERVVNLISDIDDLLQKKTHTDPDNILNVAGDVLKLELPDTDQINRLKEQMSALGMDNSDGDGETRNIVEVTELEKEATSVLNQAKQLSANVVSALENLKQSEHNCANSKSMTMQANVDNEEAKAMNTDILDSLKTLRGLMNILSELHSKDDGKHYYG